MDKKEYMKIYSKEIHRQVREPKEYRKVLSNYSYEIITMDLVDMNMYIKSNNNHRYILTILDVHSRYAWTVALMTKADTFDAFVDIFGMNNNNNVKYLWTDEGKEFYNKDFNDWCKTNNVVHYSTYGGKYKNSIIERFNRTLKMMMEKRLTEDNTKQWYTRLDDVTSRYNNRKHSTLEISPSYVLLHGRITRKTHQIPNLKKAKFKIGDFVRISRLKGIFEKEGYNWSTEIFKVKQICLTVPITYKLIDLNNNDIKGCFYDSELQKTELSDVFLVDKVIRKRKKDGKTQYFVSWIGYPKEFNSWIDSEDVVADY